MPVGCNWAHIVEFEPCIERQESLEMEFLPWPLFYCHFSSHYINKKYVNSLKAHCLWPCTSPLTFPFWTLCWVNINSSTNLHCGRKIDLPKDVYSILHTIFRIYVDNWVNSGVPHTCRFWVQLPAATFICRFCMHLSVSARTFSGYGRFLPEPKDEHVALSGYSK